MFSIDWEKSIPKPPKELLDQCYTVKYKGTKPHLKKRWALEHCDSFVWMDIESDGSWTTSTYVFYFAKEADKIMFALKYV